MLLCIPLSKSMIEITFTIALSAWITKKILIKDFRLKSTSLNFAILGFLLASIISIFNSPYLFLSIRALFSKTIQHILLFFIIIETVNTEEKLKNILKIGLISIVIVSIDGFIQYYVCHYDLFRLYPSFGYAPLTDQMWPLFPGFPTGPFPFPNDLSAWMLILLMPLLSLFAWGVKSIRTKLILGVSLFPFLFLFFLANTRGAWIGFFTSLFLILFLKNKKMLILVILIIMLIVPFLPKDKVENIVGLSSMKDRFSMWQTGFEILKEHPIIGNGVNTFFVKFKEFRNDEFKGLRGSHAHNGYLQIAADTGIVGLSFFLLIIIQAFMAGIRTVRRMGNKFGNALCLGIGSGILAFLIHSFFDTNLHSLPLIILFWFAVAVLISLNNITFRNET